MSAIATRPAVDLADTPVVTIDLDVMEANIRRLQAYCDAHGIANRPHIKTHKIPEIARAQLAAGAVGITCQKLGEVAVMLEAGLRDILVTYNVLGAAKVRRLRALADHPGARLTVAIDDLAVARALSDAFAGAGDPLRVLVECDTGAGRMGTPTPAATVELAQAIAGLPGLWFEGLMTYPVTDDTARFFEATLAKLDRAGLRANTVSTGGTPAYPRAHTVPGVTEHRAGTYVFNDRATVAAGAAAWEDCAMRVRSTVVSRPTADRAVLDAGSKTLSSDLQGQTGYGRIVEYPEAVIVRLNEEHGIVELGACARRPQVGEIVSIIPNHTCVVTNLHDALVGVRDGQAEVVWRVAARGAVR
ncbi:MAG: alanine racemase [Armatimonadota bacterium]|nr:alanine racemase [Armatimonadota bacterium]MDR7513057.1 alanine racemase [Armatimonadota bacterium]